MIVNRRASIDTKTTLNIKWPVGQTVITIILLATGKGVSVYTTLLIEHKFDYNSKCTYMGI